MTCIAAVAHNGRVTMGCDSAGTYDNFNIVEFGHSKILSLRKGEVLVGCCGSCRMLDLLEYHLQLPRLPRNHDALKALDGARIRPQDPSGLFMKGDSPSLRMASRNSMVGYWLRPRADCSK